MRKKVHFLGQEMPAAIAVILRCLLFCGIIAIFLFGYKVIRQRYYLAKAEPVWGTPSENLSFDYHNCKRAGPWFDPYVKSMEWIKDDTLQVQIHVPVNCADNNWIGHYQLDENKLLLQYITLPSLSEMACICRAELDYRISNLGKRKYSVDIQEMWFNRPSDYNPYEE